MGGFSRPIPQRLKGITVFAAGAKCSGGILLEKGRAMGNTVAVEVANMLAAAWLMLSSLFYSLQLSSGSFPRPLTEEEERYYLDLAGKGDLEARNVLIERKSAAGGAHYEELMKPAATLCGGRMGCTCLCTVSHNAKIYWNVVLRLNINGPSRRRLLAGACLWVEDRRPRSLPPEYLKSRILGPIYLLKSLEK